MTDSRSHRTDADSVERAAQAISAVWKIPPQVAVILGTGLGAMTDEMRVDAMVGYASLPGFRRSTSIGHNARLMCGSIGNTPVLAFQGRIHLYEGYGFRDVTFPVRVAAALGAKTLIVTNASGGVNPMLATGDIVAISGHINMMGPRAASARSGAAIEIDVSSSQCYCPLLLQKALCAGREAGARIEPGVYVAMLGPNYETRAEYRMVRRIGGDVVGMSTVPEAVEASRMGLRVAGLSVVANVARPDQLGKTTGEEVARAAKNAAMQLGRTVAGIVRNIG